MRTRRISRVLLASTLLLSAGLLQLFRGSAHAAVASTNGEGLIFWLEFEHTDHRAGTGISAIMGVSNTLNEPHPFRWSYFDIHDTGIGDFVVVEESTGIEIECVPPRSEREMKIISSSIGPLYGHAEKKFMGSVPQMMTNTGTYLISARASFPSTNGPGTFFEIETPPVSIRILPPTNQPPQQVTQPLTTVQPNRVEIPQSVSSIAKNASAVQESDPAIAVTHRPPNESRRNVWYGLLLLGMLLIAALLWWRLRQNRS